MPTKPNILSRFWNEIQRRKVLKVMAMYAGSAFIIIQVESSLADPLNLPRWVGTIIVIILSAGFPVTAILAWIFDLTPDGLKKTESLEELAGKEVLPTLVRRRLKTSDVVIFILTIVVVILAWPKIFKSDAIDRLRSSRDKLSVAVLPFQNLTNDTTWNVMRSGIQQSLISFLSNTGELKVQEKESINTLLQARNQVENATLSRALAGTISRKLDTDFYIFGTIQQAGPEIRVDAQLRDTKTNQVFKSFNIERPSDEENIFQVIDTLARRVGNYLLISKLIKGNPAFDLEMSPLTTNSPEALKYCLFGDKALARGDNKMAISWYLKSLDADSNYFDPMIGLSSAYSGEGMQEQNYKWVIKYYNKRKQWPPLEQLWASWAYAFSFEAPEVAINYLKQIKEITDRPSYILGYSYKQLKEYDKAIAEFSKHLELCHKWGKEFLKDNWSYSNLGSSYHQTGQYKKEKKITREWARYNKGDPNIYARWIALSLAGKDSMAVNRYIKKFTSACKEKWAISDANMTGVLAWIYSEERDIANLNKAEEYFRKSLQLDPGNTDVLNRYANFLIDNRRNISEVSTLMDKAMELAKDKVDYYNYSDLKGWGLYKQGKFKEALEVLQKTWDEAPFKLYAIRSHLEEVKKAAKEQGII